MVKTALLTSPPHIHLYNVDTGSVETYVGRGAGIQERIDLLNALAEGMQENNRRIREALANDETNVTVSDLGMHHEVLQRQALTN